MIPFKNRFHGHGSMNYLHQHGEMIRTKNFSLKYITNPRRRFSRLGVVVSRKVDKRAVKRNLIRRRVYAILYPLIKDFQQNYDLIIIIHNSDIIDTDYQILQQKIVNLLKQSAIL